jgi:hypothetical protein
MLARSLKDVIPRAWQAIGTKQTRIIVFVIERKLIALDIFSKGGKFSQLYFVDYILPHPKRENVNFRYQIPQAIY